MQGLLMAIFCRCQIASARETLGSRRPGTSTAPCRGALRPALSATPTATALDRHQVVGGEFVAIATAGRR